MTQTTIDALDLATDLVARSRKAGADAADVVVSETVALSATYRLGETEKVERAEGVGADLRVYLGKRVASVSSSDLSAKALAALVERALAMARAVPEDPFAGLADPEQLARSFPELDLRDPAEPGAERLLSLARRAEDAARMVAGVTNSEGAEAGWSSNGWVMAASNGFARRFESSNAGIAVSVIAADASGMERDDDWTSARHAADLKPPEEIGRSAGERAVRRLGSRKAPTAQVPVVFDPRVARSLLSHLTGAISGPAIARGTSFLKESLGKRIFPASITVIDDPHRRRGLRSKPCDGEGVANKRRAIIENGVLTTWLMDLRSARQLKLASTGHGARGGGTSPNNLWLEPGAASPAELIADIKSGFYVAELMGMGVNGITGDYSRGASGFWIENGRIAWPVSEMTVAGNLRDMFLKLTAAADLEFKSGVDAPTLRIDGMTVAGA